MALGRRYPFHGDRQNLILGVDIGGVIIEKVDLASDTSFFSGHYLRTPPVEGAFEAISVAGKTLFGDQVYLVSKCSPATAGRTLDWLAHNSFFDVTGIPEHRVLFCENRSDKGPICQRLGVTHFVDDKLEVLASLRSVKYRILFKPDPLEVENFKNSLSGVTVVNSWAEVRFW